jgi:hypothetical protein
MAKRYTYHVKVFRKWGSGIESVVPKKLNHRQTRKAHRFDEGYRWRESQLAKVLT